MEVSHGNTAVTSDTRCGGSYGSRYGTKVKPACDGVEFGIVQFTNIADHLILPKRAAN